MSDSPKLSDLQRREKELAVAYWNVPQRKGPYPRAHKILAMHGIAEELRKVRKGIAEHPDTLIGEILAEGYQQFIEESTHAE